MSSLEWVLMHEPHVNNHFCSAVTSQTSHITPSLACWSRAKLRFHCSGRGTSHTVWDQQCGMRLAHKAPFNPISWSYCCLHAAVQAMLPSVWLWWCKNGLNQQGMGSGCTSWAWLRVRRGGNHSVPLLPSQNVVWCILLYQQVKQIQHSV